MIQVQISTKIYPSEDENRIFELFQLFDEECEIEISERNEDGIREASTNLTGIESLTFLYQTVRKTRTVEAFRQFMLKRIEPEDTQVTFMMNKQVLTKKKAVLCRYSTESPLGPIWITISSKNLLRLIDYLFPHTEKGKVIEVAYQPTE